MSHHTDQPNPHLDISDVYCFRGTAGVVLVINVSPLKFPAAGFDSEALYEFKLDTDGDNVENIAWRVTFPVDGAGVQGLKVEQVTGRAARDRDATGRVITPEGAKPEQIITCTDGIKVFAGERGDPFFVDARLVVETRRALKTHTAPVYDWFTPETAVNTFGGSNVSAIVLEIPTAVIETDRIGFWGNTAVKENGVWHQFQHAAGPLVGFLYDFPGGEAAADFNASHPADHLAGRPRNPHNPPQRGFWKQILDDTAAVVEAMGTYDDGDNAKATPAEYGAYVADTLLPDVLRYRVGTTAEWGPRAQNGKGLTESAPESMFELVLNRHLEIGLDPSDATGTLLDHFPYLSEPISTG
jgi:hypothetical protein